MKWSIAIFAANEAHAIVDCLRSVDKNCADAVADVNVLLNGTRDDTLSVVRATTLRNAALKVYFTTVADKANAINQFIYKFRTPSATCFFIDAYVSVGDGALLELHGALERDRHAHVASAIPLRGRSARSYTQELLRGGSINGNLYAVRHEFLERFTQESLRIPHHIYRGDPLFGSMAAHDLDALGTKWDDSRLLGVGTAAYTFEPLSLFRWRDVKRQFRREVRQARGTIENEAVKRIIYKDGYAALPADANRMIRDYLTHSPVRPRHLRRRFFTQLALRELPTTSGEDDTEGCDMRLVFEAPRAGQ